MHAHTEKGSGFYSHSSIDLHTHTHTHTHTHGSHILCWRFLVSRRPHSFLVCARPWRDHYFTLEACMLRISTSSLSNIPMFNSIIITYFIPLADGKASWSVPQFYAWGFALDASWSLSASIIYFGPNKSNCICREEHHQHQTDIH